MTLIRNVHFPGRAPIDAYGNGGFRFAGMSHRGSLLCLPSGIYGWDAGSAAEIDEAHLARLFAEAAGIDTLIIGSGVDLAPIAEPLRWAFRTRRIQADVMSTGAAARTYNIMLAENRQVAAALIAVD